MTAFGRPGAVATVEQGAEGEGREGAAIRLEGSLARPDGAQLRAAYADAAASGAAAARAGGPPGGARRLRAREGRVTNRERAAAGGAGGDAGSRAPHVGRGRPAGGAGGGDAAHRAADRHGPGDLVFVGGRQARIQ